MKKDTSFGDKLMYFLENGVVFVGFLEKNGIARQTFNRWLMDQTSPSMTRQELMIKFGEDELERTGAK